MALDLDKTVCGLIRELVIKMTRLDESFKQFQPAFKRACRRANSSKCFFTTRAEIEQKIGNLAEKFIFHGFRWQADDLEKYTKTFFDASPFKEDLDVRISLMKLLLDLSRSPTTQFLEHPENFRRRESKSEEVINWTSLLMDDTKMPTEHFSDSESWDESDEEFEEITVGEVTQVDAGTKPVGQKSKFKVNAHQKAKQSRELLGQMVQSDWWNRDSVVVLPQTRHSEAHFALKWDKYLEEVTLGFIPQSINIIPEYRIIREILWQFYHPHSCFTFKLERNQVIPNSGISISSVRQHVFEQFLHEFTPYFKMLKTFRDFQTGLRGEYFVASVPDTYRSYACALDEIINPVLQRIREIEDSVRKQETPITILRIANEIRPLFNELELMYQIHVDLIQDFEENSTLQNATRLLSRLYFGLLNSSNKTEQNLYLTLYLKSLYKYCTIIDNWLTQDKLDDKTDEFVILDKNGGTSTQKNQDYLKIEYIVCNLDEFSKTDGMLSIICTKILQLGKNVHLLRLLGKLHLIQEESETQKESLHQEFVMKILEEARNYMDNDTKEINILEKQSEELLSFDPENKTSESRLDSFDTFLDLSDIFLQTIFQPYLQPETKKQGSESKSLFEQINETVTNMFPVKQILETIFLDILKRRYNIQGLMVKNLLMNQYGLKEHFGLLKHLYLFEDDIIFPFYKKMFCRFDKGQMWGNFFWLTSQLQDLFVDSYPDFYEDYRVDVHQNWRLCTNPIVAWGMVTVHFRIKWPVDIIIRAEHISKYQEVFQFILKLKWALTTLNRLVFSELEPRYKRRFALQLPILQRRIRKLELLRFLLLNDVSSVHHYVLGHLFSSVCKRFERDLEESYDLESMCIAHGAFIHAIHAFCTRLRDEMSEEYGFRKILNLVLNLDRMWHNLTKLSETELKTTELDYLKCHKFLRPIIEMNLATL